MDATTGEPQHAFTGVGVLFLAHMFGAAIVAWFLWLFIPIDLLGVLAFFFVAILLTYPLRPWYRRYYPEHESPN